jgi:hypothetical protein
MGINYQKEFGKRTVEVLEKGYEYLKTLGREVTFLMNCLLGTIVVISQNEDDKKQTKQRRNSFLVGTIDEEFLRTLGIPVKRALIGENKLKFIENIRHGIAHQHIEAVNGSSDTNESDWLNVVIKNDYQGKDFEIKFEVEELRNFAINLAKKYYEIENQDSSLQA